MRTLLIGYPKCVWLEVSAAISLLTKRMPLLVASPDGGPFAVEEGFRVEADTSYDDVSLEKVGAILVPGGDCEAAVHAPRLPSLLRSASARGILIGGICHGVLVLAKAGVLAGRACTHVCVPKYAPGPEFASLLDTAAPLFAGSAWHDENVVVDAHIVTAKPWAHLEFATTMASLAGLLNARETAPAARSLRGQGRRAEKHDYKRYVIRLVVAPGAVTSEALKREHIAWLRRLEAAGQLVAAGPFLDRQGGLIIVTAEDDASARALADGDPFVRAGVRAAEVRAWQLSCEENDHLGLG